jgi:hypothetical protein
MLDGTAPQTIDPHELPYAWTVYDANGNRVGEWAIA